MYLCRTVKSRWGLVQFKLQTELRHLKSWFISQCVKVVIYWTHFVAQLNILALQCQAADFWNYQAKNELWSHRFILAHWHFWDGLVVAEKCCAKLYGQEKKNKTQKKLSKEYLLSNDASKQISTRSSWNNTITLLCLDFDIQRAQSIRQGTWDLLLSKLMDVSLHAGGFILWCLDRIPRSWFGWSVRSVKYLSSEINGFAFCLCLLHPKLKSMSLLFGYD